MKMLVASPPLTPWIVAMAIALLPWPAQATSPAATPQVPAVAVTGRGPDTYVLVTGLVGGVAGFRRLEALLLARGARVIIIDPFRLSIDSADVSYAALARRVGAVLDTHEVRGSRVIAHSHGAGVMLRVASVAPARVAELTLIEAGAQERLRGRGLETALRLLPLVARVPGGRRLLRDRLITGMRQNSGNADWLDTATQRAYAAPLLDDVGRFAALGRRLIGAIEPESLSVTLARINIPVRVLVGGAPHEGSPSPVDMANLARLGPLLQIDTIVGAGHFLHEEAPAVVARYVSATPGAVRAGGWRRVP